MKIFFGKVGQFFATAFWLFFIYGIFKPFGWCRFWFHRLWYPGHTTDIHVLGEDDTAHMYSCETCDKIFWMSLFVADIYLEIEEANAKKVKVEDLRPSRYGGSIDK